MSTPQTFQVQDPTVDLDDITTEPSGHAYGRQVITTKTDMEQVVGAMPFEADIYEYADQHEVRIVPCAPTTPKRRQEILGAVRPHMPVTTKAVVEPREDGYDIKEQRTVDGYCVAVTDGGNELWVGAENITEDYEGRPMAGDLFVEVEHRIKAGELPTSLEPKTAQQDAAAVEKPSEMFTPAERKESPENPLIPIHDAYVEGDINIYEMEERIEEEVTLSDIEDYYE